MFLRYNLYSIIWAIIILILTLTPGTAMPLSDSFTIPNLDKIVHFTIFSVLAFLMVRGFSRQNDYKILQKKSIIISFLISICFGIIIEIIQTFIPGRGFDIVDIVANLSGILFGLSVYYLKDKSYNSGF